MAIYTEISTLPLPLLAAAVLAFAAAALPAAGQSSVTLVSNTGQSASNQSFSNDWFNAFTVGSNTHGYRLTGVDMILTSGASLTATYEVRIHPTNPDGGLGSSLGTLSPPSTASNGTNTFTTSGIDLKADSTYAVVFDVFTTGNNVGGLGATGSDDEDSGAATGWSIANGARFRTATSSGGFTLDNLTSLRFAIKGFAKTASTPPLLLGPAAPGTPTVTKGSTSGALAVSWTAPAGTITDYDLRYFAGSADPTDADDWVTKWAGLPDPGTATSDTIKGLLANTAYRVQVRAANSDGEGPWSASGSQTTATAPASNKAPRMLELKTGDTGNDCQVKTDTTTPWRTVPTTAAGGRGSIQNPITRGTETTDWPVSCTRDTNRQVPMFDDQNADVLFLTAVATVPDNVRVYDGFPSASRGQIAMRAFAAYEQANVRVDVTATDPHGASVTGHVIFPFFTLPDRAGAPSLSTVSAKSFTKDEEIEPFMLPAATGGDVTTVVGNVALPNPYWYKVAGLPAGLSFDPSTRTVSGTPTTVGSSTVTYTAEDADDEDAGDTPNPNDTASQTFTISVVTGTATAPTVTASSVNGTTLTLTFSESLSTTAAPAASRFTVGGLTPAPTVSSVAFKSGDATKVELTLSTAVGADDTGITVSYAKGTDANPLQNAAGTAEVADFTGQSVDNETLPVVTAAALNGLTLTLTFGATLSSATPPATSRFTVAGAAAATTVSAVAIPSADATKVILTLSRRVGAAETGVTVAYAKGTDANPLKATGTDNEVADFSGRTVTNNTPPAVTSVTVASTPAIDADSDNTPETYGLGEIIRIEVEFDETVAVDASGGTPRLRIDMQSATGGEQWASYEKAVEESLFFTYAVTATDASTEGIAVLANTLELNGGTIQSATGVNANLEHTGLAHDANHKVAGSQTGAAPEFRSAVISASTMTVTFNKGLDATSQPAGSAFTLSVHPPGGGPATQTISGTGTTSISGAEVTVTLASSPPASSPVGLTLNYAKPSADPLRDAGGGQVATFSETTIGKSGSDVRIRVLSRPSAPAAPTVTRASATSLSVSWRAPSNRGASAITDYDLRYYQGTSDPSNAADWIEEGEANGPPDPGTSTSATITGLTANAEYRVQVRAKNSAGTGPWSASGSVSRGGPTTPLSPPAGGTLSDDGTGATLGFAYTLDASSVPGAGDFTVRLGAASSGAGRHRVTAVSIRGSALDLTISPPVPAGRDAVVSYAKGSSPLRAFDGREVPDFSVTASRRSTPPPPSSNQPPAFESDEYAFELPENLDGSVDPVVVGTVAATDPDGDALSYYLVWTGGERFEAGDESGAILYAGPGEDFEAEPNPYELALRATDPGGESAETYITVTVVDANDAPEAADDAAATDEDVAVEVDVLANDTDIDGDDLRVASVSAPENGTAAVTAAGAVLYTPDADWHGTDSFSYVANDGRGGTAEASVEVTVAPVNDPPEAADDEAVTVEDRAVEVDVLANDTDIDGDDLRIASVSEPEHGTAAVTEGGGGVLYTPPANWHGTDSFTYAIDDGSGGTAEASVEVTVRPENDAPMAADDEAATDEDMAVEVDVLANDTDIDGDDLRVASVSAPSNGTAVVAAAGGVRYTPAANWHGTDSFTYTIDDGYGGTAEASVEVTVAPVNDLPEAADDEAATDEDVAVEVSVLANDTDIDGDSLRVSSVSAPSNGTAVVAAAGVVRYTPPANWHGTDSFTYAIDDGSGGTAEASVEVTVLPVNDPPEAADDEAATDEDVAVEVAVLANDTDIDGDALRVASVSAPANGTAAVAAGEVVYTPDANWYGTDAFTYAIDDGNGGTAEAAVTVTVLPVNDPPVAADDEAADDEDRAVEVDVLANDTDIDGDALRVSSVSAPSNGTAAVTAGGSGVRYTPAADWHGTDSFTYAIDDGNGGTASASVEVTVAAVNDAPEAADDAASTNEDESVTVDVLANDTDPDGDGLTVSSVSAPENGTADVTAGGRGVRYVPAADWHGTDSFTYAIDDGNGGTASASVAVTVLPVNDGPEAVGAIPGQSLDEGGEPARIELGPFFADTDGDALEYRASSSDPSVVEASVSGSVLTLSPAGYGTTEVTVTATDAGGLTATQTVSVGVSDRPAREAVSHALAGLARSHLASARMTLGRRATASRHESSRLTLLGRKVPLGAGSARSTAEQMWEGWLSGVTSRAMSHATPYAGGGGMPGFGAGAGTGPGMPVGRGTAIGAPRAGASVGAPTAASAGAGAPMGAVGGPSAVGRRGSGDDMGLGDLFRLGDLVRLQGGRDPLQGSEFLFALGGGQEAGGGGGGLRLQLWGQGDVQTFQGAPSDASDYDGELRTGYVGVDTWLTDRWMLGVAVARSEGTGGWRAGSASGSLDTRLLAVHPYLRWSSGGTSIWATGGAGWGDAENVRDRGGRTETSGLGLRLGLVELRQRLAAAGGFEFGLRADAGWAELATDTGTETLDDQTAAVNQARFGIEMSQSIRLGGLTLTPFGEANARRDGGDGQTGDGLELAGGLRARAGFLRIDAQGRMLAVHSAAGYEERGLAVTLSLGNPGGEGPSLSMSPRWGDAATGGDALWREQIQSRYVPAAIAVGAEPAADGNEIAAAVRDPWGLDLRGGYGMRISGDRLLTWTGSLNHSPAGARFTLGAQIGLGIGRSSGTEPSSDGAMVP